MPDSELTGPKGPVDNLKMMTNLNTMSIIDELPETRAANGARCLICGFRQRSFFAPKPGVEAELCFNCAFPKERPRCDCCGVRVDVEVTDLGPMCRDCVNGICPRCEDDCYAEGCQ